MGERVGGVPAAGGHWGLRTKPHPPEAGGKSPAARSKGIWGEASSAERFLQFFNKNNVFVSIFRPNSIRFLGTHLFVKVPRARNSEVTFFGIRVKLSLGTTSLTTQR